MVRTMSIFRRVKYLIGGVKYLIGGKCKECRGRDREDTLTEEGRQMGTYVRKES